MRSEIIKERLQQILDEKGITKTTLAKAANVTSQAVNNWFNNGKVSADSARAISDEFGYSVDWILGGSNTIITGNAKLSNSSVTTTVNNLAGNDQDIVLAQKKPDDGHFYRIDYIDVRAAAGVTGFSNSDYPEIINKIYLSEDGLRALLGRKNTNDVCMINIPTDSMEPTIKKGDVVLIDTSIKFYNGEGIYAFSIDGELYIKRLQKIPDEGIVAISDNSEKYKEFKIKDETYATAKFVGKFIKCWRIEIIDL